MKFLTVGVSDLGFDYRLAATKPSTYLDARTSPYKTISVEANLQTNYYNTGTSNACSVSKLHCLMITIAMNYFSHK